METCGSKSQGGVWNRQDWCFETPADFSNGGGGGLPKRYTPVLGHSKHTPECYQNENNRQAHHIKCHLGNLMNKVGSETSPSPCWWYLLEKVGTETPPLPELMAPGGQRWNWYPHPPIGHSHYGCVPYTIEIRIAFLLWYIIRTPLIVLGALQVKVVLSTILRESYHNIKSLPVYFKNPRLFTKWL